MILLVLTYGHLATMSPFENKMTAFNVLGTHLLEALEFSLNEIDLSTNKTSSSIFLQLSGLKVTYDFRECFGQRVRKILVRCQKCSVPAYVPFDTSKVYRLVAPDFIMEGGGGFSMFAKHATDIQYDIQATLEILCLDFLLFSRKEMTDLEAVVEYVRDHRSIYTGLEKRIIVHNN